MAKNLNQKLFEIQKQRVKFEKNAENPFFKSKYLSLEALWEQLAPELEKHNLLVTHNSVDGAVQTTVTDIDSDESLSSAMTLPLNLDPQKMGSAVTYFKRYNLGQLFNIMTDVDDDGNDSSKQTGKKLKTTDDLDL